MPRLRHFSEIWTLCLIIACFAIWGISLFILPVWIAMPIIAVVITFQASLQHELIHGHPFDRAWANHALGLFSLNLVIPYFRFRDTHLAHHKNENLTDPFDDPESNFLCAPMWRRRWRLGKVLLQFNNTLAGRLILGPALGQWAFLRLEFWHHRGGDRRVLIGWVAHIPAIAMIITIIWISPMPIWAYAIAAYGGLSLLKIRTFAEHQAHEKVGGRTAVIEDRGPLAFLFLFNNFHALHHMHPNLPWYQLPRLYAEHGARVRRYNRGYVIAGYGALFRRYFLRRKDAVLHPRWHHRKDGDRAGS